MSFTVKFFPKNVDITLEDNVTVLEAAFRAGVEINSACGGKGTCGRCRVLVEGKVESAPSKQISQEEWDRGWRLACMTTIFGDAAVFVPEESRVEDLQIYESFTTGDVEELSPISTATYLEIPVPNLENNLGDKERLEACLRLSEGSLDIPIEMLRDLPKVVRDSGWRVTSVLDRSGDRPQLIDVNNWDTSGRNFGIALDIGTTTVVLALVDLQTGKTIAQASDYNKQIMCGEDVLARIAFAEDGGLERLRQLILESIDYLISQVVVLSDVCRPTVKKVCREEVTAMSIAGNTTMIHLLLGLHPKQIRYEPYVSVANLPPVYRAKDLDIKIHPQAPIYIVPGRASYVGGDIVADVLASGLHKRDETALLIDVGTNGEVVLGNKDWTVSCSCSAGPAFEGGEVASGMRAMTGAIEKVTIDAKFEPSYQTIRNDKPRGLCGSGLIDLVSEMFRVGLVDKKGHIQDVGSQRVRWNGDSREYVVVWAKDTKETAVSLAMKAKSGVWGAKTVQGNDIVITDGDIANIIRTKAAMFAAAEVLLDSVKVNFNDLDRVYIAGGFGNYIDVEKAINIGLLPDIPRDRFVFLGNAALGGAWSALLSRERREEAKRVYRSMTYLELTTNQGFFDHFTSALFLPHTEIEKFPSVMGRRKNG
ncbi:MAG: Na(+)-translocating NADH-quinone reductase subunit F [Methanomassiliicoccales archaeon PtaU1.Bin124]|nr:MAG: Na(+)-translocating NADH-quinone reductase subunit F [Methanomassiliicoccales archaeon PtaU1.Bin124]